MIHKGLFLPLFLVLLSFNAHAKRTLFASQFSLINESQAHVNFGNTRDWAFDPESIKVMVWNLKKAQEPNWDRDFKYYGQDRDLFILSEGYLNPLMKGTFESFEDFRWDMGVAFLYKKDNNTKTGTVIGSKVQPTDIKVRHTSDLEPFILTPKALTIGKYPIAGTNKELLVISVHAINAVTTNAFERHMQLAREEMVKHDGPIIFAGDFNTNLGAKVKFLKKMTTDLGMQSIEFQDDKRMKSFGQVIDYIFVKDLYPKKSKVLGHLKSSDHKAMMAELKYVE